MNELSGLLLLRRLRVQNANAISGPLTWGFPAPSAFTGFVHGLERNVCNELALKLGGVGIVCHHFSPQVHQPVGRRTRVFALTRNPIGSDEKSAAFVEEGRCNLEVTLVIEVAGTIVGTDEKRESLARRIFERAVRLRLAGGSIIPSHDTRSCAELKVWPESDEDRREAFRKLRRTLLPGFALIERGDLLRARFEEIRRAMPQATLLDALLDFARLNFEPVSTEFGQSEGTEWRARHKPGWIVPIPVGYHAISRLYEPGEVKNARDEKTPFRFVESVYSLGEWISPHRLESHTKLMWYPWADAKSGKYLCRNVF